MMAGETQYFSKDFDFEDLRQEIESDASYHHHFQPFNPPPPPPPSSSSCPPGAAAVDAEAWACFHKRHFTGRFFKERRYLLKEFPELTTYSESIIVLEVGCGNGSTVLPILRGNGSIAVYACDCSLDALERTSEAIATAGGELLKQRFHPFLCDVSNNGFPNWLFCSSCTGQILNKRREPKPYASSSCSCRENLFRIGGVNYVTLIFTLSAVPFQKMPFVISECLSVMKPGSLLFFRDYGLYDMTMLRFEANQRVGFREYVRADGTRSYYFTLDIVRDLFASAGFTEIELEYCCVKSVNRLKGKHMRRVWIHGKFQKPVSTSSSS